MGPKLGDQNWGTKAGGPKLDDKNWGTKTDRCLSLKFPQSTRILPNQPEFPNLPKCASNNFGDAIFQVTLCFCFLLEGATLREKGDKGEKQDNLNVGL